MRELQVRLRAIGCATAFMLSGATAACAGSGTHGIPSTTLKSSSGGTAMSKSGGNGGTGIPTTANAPLGTFASTFKPAHATAPPPAGVRPETDLAAARKLTDLSSRRLTKESTLYNKIVLGPQDSNLVQPYAGKMASKDGGGASFKQTPGFTAAESKGNVYVTNGGIDNNSRETASLSSHGGAHTVFAAESEPEPDAAARRPTYGLLDWMMIAFASLATAGIGSWLWQQAPTSARMMVPAKAA